MTTDPRPLSGATERTFIMPINVITPFSRNQFAAQIQNQLAEGGVIWHRIMARGFKPSSHGDGPGGMVRDYVIDMSPTWNDPPYWKLNWFLDNALDEKEWYCVLNDDDAYTPEFFDIVRDAIAQHPECEVFITSANRGDNIPPGALIQTTQPAIAHASQMRVNDVGVEQMIIRGSRFYQYRYADNRSADGMLISKVVSDAPDKVCYVPSAEVLFNYYEAGRYSAALKSQLFPNQTPP